MMNKLTEIIPNPYKNLTKSQIEIYYHLLNTWLSNNCPEKFNVPNKYLSGMLHFDASYITESLKKMEQLGLIRLEYIPDKKGLKRFIYFTKTA